MSDTPRTDMQSLICEQALALIAEDGQNLYRLDVLMETCVEQNQDEASDLQQFSRLVPDQASLVALCMRDLWSRVLADMGAPDPSLSVRERLFDLIMTRFEIMNQQRQAWLNMDTAIRRDVWLSLQTTAFLMHTIKRMLAYAGAQATPETDGFYLFARKALQPLPRALYLANLLRQVFKVWSQDESQDLAKTMKDLDKALAKAEALAEKAHL